MEITEGHGVDIVGDVERTDGVHAHHSGAEHHHQRRAGHRHRGALLSTDEHCLTLPTTDR